MIDVETRVLVIDQDQGSAEGVARILEARGCRVRIATDARAAEVLCQIWRPQLALLDLRPPLKTPAEAGRSAGEDPLVVLHRMKAQRPALPIIATTAAATVDLAVEALTTGAVNLLQKPIVKDKLIAAVEKAGAGLSLTDRPSTATGANGRAQRAREGGTGAGPDAASERSMQELSGIVTQDPMMLRALDMLRTAAPTNVNVLILGENGTGKELAATALHLLSHRRARPFVKINCAAIPGELLESELFGYRRGAFTGAAADKKGLFELANRGSMLLDEIGEMPPYLQAKLLRVLQEREFRPLGATSSVKADFRLICSTNVEPLEQVRRGKLRKDLYFRLNTISVELVPLRDRPADIPLLTRYFLERFAAQHARSYTGIDPEAMQLLERHTWPGNVRELEHAIERAVILGRGSLIVPANLPDSVLRPSRASLARVGLPGGCTLEELERLAIMQTLELTGWNKRVAARLLGIHRPTLYNKLRKYRLWRSEDRFWRETRPRDPSA